MLCVNNAEGMHSNLTQFTRFPRRQGVTHWEGEISEGDMVPGCQVSRCQRPRLEHNSMYTVTLFLRRRVSWPQPVRRTWRSLRYKLRLTTVRLSLLTWCPIQRQCVVIACIRRN